MTKSKNLPEHGERILEWTIETILFSPTYHSISTYMDFIHLYGILFLLVECMLYIHLYKQVQIVRQNIKYKMMVMYTLKLNVIINYVHYQHYTRD